MSSDTDPWCHESGAAALRFNHEAAEHAEEIRDLERRIDKALAIIYEDETGDPWLQLRAVKRALQGLDDTNDS